MAFVKITQLPQTSSITNDDLFVLVDDPAGNPTTKKIAVGDLLPFFQGQVGPTGPPGPTGAGIVVLGVLANPSLLPISGGNVGDAYIVLSTGDLYIWDGSVWQNAGPSGTPGVGVPVGGTSGQALVKIDNTNYNTQWSTLIPTGGATGESLIKLSNSNYDFGFETLVPSGGSANQVLAKIDGTDYNTQWASPLDATKIPLSLVDAKGDVIAATANDTVTRLPVGSNNQVLIADSSTSTGLRWGSGGRLLQFATISVSTQSTTANSATDIPGLAISFTPTSASSTIITDLFSDVSIFNNSGLSFVSRVSFVGVVDTVVGNFVQIGRNLVSASTDLAVSAGIAAVRTVSTSGSTSARTIKGQFYAGTNLTIQIGIMGNVRLTVMEVA